MRNCSSIKQEKPKRLAFFFLHSPKPVINIQSSFYSKNSLTQSCIFKKFKFQIKIFSLLKTTASKHYIILQYFILHLFLFLKT